MTLVTCVQHCFWYIVHIFDPAVEICTLSNVGVEVSHHDAYVSGFHRIKYCLQLFIESIVLSLTQTALLLGHIPAYYVYR